MQKTCLIVIDGWGISTLETSQGDAIRNAKTPIMTKLQQTYPQLPIAAHGLAVGLPDGLMGNSEVGHLNIGAGRIVYQDIVRIESSIKNDSLKNTNNLKYAFERALKTGRLHLLGLVSDGGVHSHIDHLLYLISKAKEYGIPETFVHFFGDGRDTAPKSSLGYMKVLLDYMTDIGYGKVASVVGRYYAMDRDKRWERIKVCYEMLVQGKGERTKDILKTIEQRYENDETDEFLKPIIVDEQGIIKDDDTLIFFNYRSDRMRELTSNLGIELEFETSIVPKNIELVTMTRYKSDYPFKVLFPAQSMDNVLAEWLGKQKVLQAHCAETEKYAHVTFFFNGGTENSYDGEDRFLIPSPKVATYDLEPEMSAIKVAEKVAEIVKTDKYGFVMCNFANPDMVGHTGKYEPAIKAVETTDAGIGIIYEACKEMGYTLFVTADHGNAEQMINLETGEPHTAHTCNKGNYFNSSICDD